MSQRTICDGCGATIPQPHPVHYAPPGEPGDGYARACRTLLDRRGNAACYKPNDIFSEERNAKTRGNATEQLICRA